LATKPSTEIQGKTIKNREPLFPAPGLSKRKNTHNGFVRILSLPRLYYGYVKRRVRDKSNGIFSQTSIGSEEKLLWVEIIVGLAPRCGRYVSMLPNPLLPYSGSSTKHTSRI